MSINEGGSVALIHDRAEQIVSEAIELALARMVLEAKAGRNRTELLDALEQIQINHPHNKTTPTSSGLRSNATTSSSSSRSGRNSHNSDLRVTRL